MRLNLSLDAGCDPLGVDSPAEKRRPLAPSGAVFGLLLAIGEHPSVRQQPRRFMRPGTPGRWIRLRPRVRGTDGSGLATGDDPQEAPKKDDFRRRCQRPTDLSTPNRPRPPSKTDSSAPGAVFCRVPGCHGEGKRAFENTILGHAALHRRALAPLLPPPGPR